MRVTIPMKQRSADEIKAYVDGYNDAFERFKECLKGRKSVVDSVRKMELFVNAVNCIAYTEERKEQTE